ncbi:putative protein serine/threonine kinase [Blastocladiella emersonii ATCC 22665]|nr:putative protein serine/threonine kinase [Blastocladiella emersonii ATCC 22665]
MSTTSRAASSRPSTSKVAPSASSWTGTAALAVLASVATLASLGYISITVNLDGTPQSIQPASFLAPSPAPAPAAASRTPTRTADCLVLGGVPQLCPADERVWSESLTHAALLWHPTPRKVLILGPLGASVVAEALRHFTLTDIVWVSGLDQETASGAAARDTARVESYYDIEVAANTTAEFKYDDVSDILRKARVKHVTVESFLSRASSGQHAKYDVVLVDHVAASAAHLSHVADVLLAPGGVVAAAERDTTSLGLLPALARQFPHVHVAAQRVESVGSTFQFYYATQSDLHLAPTAMSPALVDANIRRRVFDGSEDLDHYDGESHLGMFHLPLALRKRVRAVLDAHRPADADAKKSYAPSEHAGSMRADSVPGATLLREYFDCDKELLDDTSDLVAAVRRGLEFSHATVVALDVYDDEDEEDENLAAFKDDPAAAAVMVSATLRDGHFTLRAYPKLGYAAAEYSSYAAKETSPEEVLGFLAEELTAKRTVGTTVPRGRPSYETAGAAGAPLVDLWYHGNDYYMSPKVEVRSSPTAGRGQFAGADIAAGEVLFRGPIETYLRHEVDIAAMAPWRVAFINHMGEQAEDDVWIAPPLYDEDPSYFTNHNCDPNLVYTGYDTMVARRDIKKGDELTFDYATADAEPRPLFKCNCGAATCRGHVHGNDWTRPELVEAYGVKHFWPHIQKKILQHRAGLPVPSLVDPSYAEE